LMVAAAIAVAGWERPRLRLSLVFAQIRETIPFSFSIFFSMIYFMSDMAILKWRLGETAAGVYTPAQRIIEPLLMVAGIWGTAVFPALCRFSVNDPDAYTRLKKTSARLALLVAFPIGFGIAFLAEPIMALLTGESPGDIAETVFVLRLLCVVTPFFYFNAVGQEFLYSAHRNWFVAGSYGCAAVISVTMNVLFIPRWGVPAVAVTAIAANLCVSAAFVWGMQHEYGAMGLIPLVARTMLACAVMGLAACFLAPVSLVLAVGVGGLVYVCLQLALRTLTPEERRLMLLMAQSPLRRLTGRGA
jgi:O-antigen/teichoic acid export membrane protein